MHIRGCFPGVLKDDDYEVLTGLKRHQFDDMVDCVPGKLLNMYWYALHPFEEQTIITLGWNSLWSQENSGLAMC